MWGRKIKPRNRNTDFAIYCTPGLVRLAPSARFFIDGERTTRYCFVTDRSTIWFLRKDLAYLLSFFALALGTDILLQIEMPSDMVMEKVTQTTRECEFISIEILASIASELPSIFSHPKLGIPGMSTTK
jgi:hypothetical protein